MRKIKILLSSRPKLLSEVIRNMIERQPDMVVVEEVIDPIKLLRAPMATSVDVVIVTPLASNGEPKICHHLLAMYPALKIITFSAEGEAAYLYQSGAPRHCIDEPSGPLILSAIRDAMRLEPGV